MNVDQQIDELIEREGEYVNHPADRGGPTRFGITEQRARAYGYKGDMRTLPRETAVQIYRKAYWERPGFDEVAKRMPKVAEELFDTGVNMGQKRAGEFLQISLNALNQEAKDYPDVPEDGDVGPMSLHALDRFQARRGIMAETVLLRALNCLQGEKYIAITRANQSQEAFLYGWLLNRVGALC